jgi:hypothetical protein
MEKIRNLANTEPTIYLPTHDEKSEKRLREKKVMFKIRESLLKFTTN